MRAWSEASQTTDGRDYQLTLATPPQALEKWWRAGTSASVRAVNVDWAVTCRYAESDGSTGTIIGAGIDVLYVPQFPHWVSIMLAVRLAGTLEEVSEGTHHQIVGRVLGSDGEPVQGPDGSEVSFFTADFSGAGWAQQVRGWLVNPLIAFRLRWWVTEEGTYTIQVRVDDSEPRLSPVHVLPQPTD